LCLIGNAGVDPAVVESRADEMVGSVSRDEYKALVAHLSGVRRNRVFHALGLSAPQRAAEVKLAEGQDAAPAHASGKAKALEKIKRKRASSSAAPTKKSRILDDILHQSPLRSKGESEDGGSEDSNRPPTAATSFGIPQGAVPLRAVHPGLDLEFSTALESEDEGDVKEVNVVVDSPRRLSLPRGAPTSSKEAEVPFEENAEASPSAGKNAEASPSAEKSTSSRTKGSGGEGSSSSSDSSSFFVRDADPEAAAVELGAKPTAVRLGGNIVKSLRFESRDRERGLLAAAGESFCFPLMEKDLMVSGRSNILEST